MGKVHEQLDDALVRFIGRQHVFFVGTAPASPEGHLNVSPKGLDTFRILGPKSVAYLDLTGSGIETVAHIRQNGRITINLARNGKCNVLTVDDNGPGIRADSIDRIFERFYTDRPSGEAFGQNSGLGLAITRQIVEAHRGAITAENRRGTDGGIAGARFTVTLPLPG